MDKIMYDGEIYYTIRRNIKKYRKQNKMTAAKLAEMVGLSHDFIRQIESEKARYNFSVATFYKISVALEVTLDQLIEKSTKAKKKNLDSTLSQFYFRQLGIFPNRYITPSGVRLGREDLCIMQFIKAAMCFLRTGAIDRLRMIEPKT